MNDSHIPRSHCQSMKYYSRIRQNFNFQEKLSEQSLANDPLYLTKEREGFYEPHQSTYQR